jgi:hypothetical protein
MTTRVRRHLGGKLAIPESIKTHTLKAQPMS